MPCQSQSLRGVNRRPKFISPHSLAQNGQTSLPRFRIELPNLIRTSRLKLKRIQIGVFQLEQQPHRFAGECRKVRAAVPCDLSGHGVSEDLRTIGQRESFDRLARTILNFNTQRSGRRGGEVHFKLPAGEGQGSRQQSTTFPWCRRRHKSIQPQRVSA